MIIRSIRPEELRLYYEVRALTYHTVNSRLCSDSAETVAARALHDPLSREEEAWRFHYAAFSDDDREMLGGLALHPYSVRFDGHTCSLMGIGGVATLPPYRRMGVIRGCMEAALRDMYAAGAVFSYLYPFSTVFYRKFGFERCSEQKKYRLLIDLLPDRNPGGAVALIKRGDDFRDSIRSLSEAANGKINFSVIPDRHWLSWVQQYDPIKTGETAYLYSSASGVPKAFMTLRRERDAQGFLNIVCSRIVFSDSEGFFGLCSLIRSFRSDCRRWVFSLPACFDLIPLLPETSLWAVECAVEQSGMVRVVNAAEALRIARYIGSGCIALRINDAQIPENDGVFCIEYRDGVCQSAVKTDRAPDAEMDISVFSRLISGACAPESLPDGAFTLHTAPEKLSGMFYRKPCFMDADF